MRALRWVWVGTLAIACSGGGSETPPASRDAGTSGVRDGGATTSGVDCSQSAFTNLVLAYDLRSDADVQALAGETLIDGNIRIAGNVDLSPLEDVTEITGTLWIEDVGIRSLAGLESLERIGGFLWLKTPRLESTAPLAALTTVACKVVVSEAELLEDARFDGLRLAYALEIWSDSVTNIGAPLLTELPAGLRVHAETKPTLSFPMLERVGGDVILHNVATITSTSFPMLRTAGAGVRIEEDRDRGPDSIVFPNLESVRNTFLVRVSTVRFVDLPSLTEAGGVDVHAFDRIAAPVLTTLGSGEFRASLIDIGALTSASGLSVRGGDVRAQSLTEVRRLTGYDIRNIDLSSLTSIEDLEMSGRQVDLDIPLVNVERFEYSGTGTITLSRLESIGDLWVQHAAITDVGSITEFRGELYVAGVPMTDLTVFENVQSVGHKLSIHSNAALTSFGLTSLTSVGDAVAPSRALVSLVDNPGVRQCDIDTLVMRLTANGFVGRVRNDGNGPACN